MKVKKPSVKLPAKKLETGELFDIPDFLKRKKGEKPKSVARVSVKLPKSAVKPRQQFNKPIFTPIKPKRDKYLGYAKGAREANEAKDRGENWWN